MKVTRVQQIPNLVKSVAVVAPLMFASVSMNAKNMPPERDVFVKSQKTELVEVPDSMLNSPEVAVGDDVIYPAVVVDLSEGLLYHYDLEGYLYDAYPIAQGKSTTPTKPGLRVVTGIEKYPYSTANKSTKRSKNPGAYGPYTVCLANVDTKTGKITGSDGQFIHGTNQPNTIGKKLSKGCVRLENEQVSKLVENLYKEQYVLIRE